MKMNDGKLKNILRVGVKLLNKGKYDKYVRDIRERSKDISEFSLLTSDCMAGLIYHTMGRQFLSPTINLSITDADFLKLLTDMPYYFAQPIHFEEYEDYPLGIIGEDNREIRIKFEYYQTEQEAVRKWIERSQRLLDSLYIVVADQNLTDLDLEIFKNLQDYLPVRRKVMFTWNKERADGKEIFYVKPYGREHIKNWSKLRKDGFRDYEMFFDYVKWLNMEDNFMLE